MPNIISSYLTTSWNRCNAGKKVSSIDSGTIFTTLIILIGSLPIFFGMFFGLNYPQVVINKYYVGAHCSITNTTIISSYCPSVSCSSCNDAPGSPSCSSVTKYQSSLDPQKCANDPSQCARGTSCNDGYSCCSQCCSTCESCSTSCTSSSSVKKKELLPAYNVVGELYTRMQSNLDTDRCTHSYSTNSSNLWDRYIAPEIVTVNCTHRENSVKNGLTVEGCTTSCSSYQCNCYCCVSVDHLSCYATPNICYMAVLYLTYDDMSGNNIPTTYTQNMDTNLAAAQNYIMNQYVVGHTYNCYYDTRNEMNVRWSIEYNVGYWVGTCIFALIVFICIVVLSHPLLAAIASSNLSEWCLHTCYVWLWVGVIIPLVIFLPLFSVAAISKEGRIALLVLIFQFVTIGLMPYVYYRWNAVVIAAYVMLIYTLVGWITPLFAWYMNDNSGAAAGLIGFGIFVIFISCYTRMHSQQQWDREHPNISIPSIPPAIITVREQSVIQLSNLPDYSLVPAACLPPAYSISQQDASPPAYYMSPPSAPENQHYTVRSAWTEAEKTPNY